MTFPYSGENKRIDDAVRKSAKGSFVPLSGGVTHYELDGPQDGKTVVLVHGFSVPYFIFDVTFEFLIGAGFRVLRYDLFGRGLSDRPNVKYNIRLFIDQLKDLLDALHLKEITLLGLSMGGPISASFIAQYPEYVSRHILIDPAGVTQTALGWLAAAKLPMLGELALGLFGSDTMVKGIAADLYDPSLVEHFQNQFKLQMQYSGFKRAILSTLRNNMLDSFYETYAQVGRMQKPTLLLWGEMDNTTPFENSKLLLKALPLAEFHSIPNCGHIPHYEKAEMVNPLLLEFLSR